jgi:hypothetical protein
MASDDDGLRSLERGMWERTTRGDPGWMDRHLHPDFAEFGRSGRRYDRTEALGVPVPDFVAELDEIDVATIGDGVALLTYRSAFHLVGDEVEEYANRTSVWVRLRDGWRLRFHQGTPCGDWRA